MLPNTNNKIELKRGILRGCDESLMTQISELDNFESFYADVFNIYGVPFDIATIRQKRSFVSAVTKYFIFSRLPKGIADIDPDGDYNCKNRSKVKGAIIDAIEKFYEILDSSSNNDEFKINFAKYFKEEVRDFSKEISENRDDSLSDFAKAIEKIYEYGDGKNSK